IKQKTKMAARETNGRLFFPSPLQKTKRYGSVFGVERQGSWVETEEPARPRPFFESPYRHKRFNGVGLRVRRFLDFERIETPVSGSEQIDFTSILVAEVI